MFIHVVSLQLKSNSDNTDFKASVFPVGVFFWDFFVSLSIDFFSVLCDLITLPRLLSHMVFICEFLNCHHSFKSISQAGNESPSKVHIWNQNCEGLASERWRTAEHLYLKGPKRENKKSDVSSHCCCKAGVLVTCGKESEKKFVTSTLASMFCCLYLS